MSSFIQSQKHFRLIQAAIKHCLNSNKIDDPLNQYAIPYKLRKSYDHNPKAVNDFVNALIKANVESVNNQYNITEEVFTIEDINEEFSFNSLDFLKALNGLNYQIETWTDKKTKKMFNALRLCVANRYCSTRDAYDESEYWSVD
jgi:hypothetical protein